MPCNTMIYVEGERERERVQLYEYRECLFVGEPWLELLTDLLLLWACRQKGYSGQCMVIQTRSFYCTCKKIVESIAIAAEPEQVLSVWGQQLFFLFFVLCLIWHVVERYG